MRLSDFRTTIVLLSVSACAFGEPVAGSAPPSPIMQLLIDELTYTMANLQSPDGVRPYFLNYTVYEEHTATIGATLGAVSQDQRSDERNLNIDLRVGEYKLDSTHQLRGGGPTRPYGNGNVALPLSNDADAIKHALWYNTDQVFKNAVKRFTQIKTDLAVKVAEEDKSDEALSSERSARAAPRNRRDSSTILFTGSSLGSVAASVVPASAPKRARKTLGTSDASKNRSR
jgi:hypothetical protein